MHAEMKRNASRVTCRSCRPAPTAMPVPIGREGDQGVRRDDAKLLDRTHGVDVIEPLARTADGYGRRER